MLVGLSDDLLERCFRHVASASCRDLARSGVACQRWHSVVDREVCWQVVLVCGFDVQPYVTAITKAGISSWASFEPTCDLSIPSFRSHLKCLHGASGSGCGGRLRRLCRFLRQGHNGIEVESLGRFSVSLEFMNFWPHESWILLRQFEPSPTDDSENVSCGSSSTTNDLSVDLSGQMARLRILDAICPPGRVGQQFCFGLDCGASGNLFRVPPASTLEIGKYPLLATSFGTLQFECLMGRWPEDCTIVGLPACSADGFIHNFKNTIMPDETELSSLGVDTSWITVGGRFLPDTCVLSPILYRSTVALNDP